MSDLQPSAEIDDRYGSPGAEARPWSVAWDAFDRAEIYWLSTVRLDGRPHITPIVAVCLDGRAYFSSGPGNRNGVLNGGGGGDAFVFRIEPAKAFSFGRGAEFSQTRYRFDRG